MSVKRRIVTDMPSTTNLPREAVEIIEDRAAITSKLTEIYKVKADQTDNLPGTLEDKADDSITVDTEEHKLTLKGDRSNLKNLDVYYGVDGDGEYGFWTLDDVLDRICFKPKGVYNPKEIYGKLDVVTYHGGLYACLYYNVCGILPTNPSYWRLVLSSSWLVEEANMPKPDEPKPEPPKCCHHHWKPDGRRFDLINAIIANKHIKHAHMIEDDDDDDDDSDEEGSDS